MRMRTTFAVPFLFAALFAVLSGCGQNQQAGPPQAGEPEVTIVTVSPMPVTLSTELPGRTTPHMVAEVRPQVSGIVQKRLFTEGSEVKAGQPLYQIDAATYQAAYNSARAALAKAEASALPARLKGERFGSLVQVNAISKQDNDDAQAANRQADSEVVAARANLESARINLSYARVTAPISGRIGKSSVTAGALVTANQAAALATVQQTDLMYVDVTQSSAEVMRLKRDLQSGHLKKSADGGAKVKLLFEDGTAYSKEGTLQFSDITVDQNTGVITLRALFPNPNNDLLPGLYVRAVLEEGVEEAAILVPQPAVSRDTKGNPLVMVVKADNTVEPRPITVDRVVGDKWLVKSGLAAGDRVIVEGLQKARPGAKVKPVEAAAPAAAQANATAPAPEAQADPKAAEPQAAAPAAKAEPVKAEPVKVEPAKAGQAQDAPTPKKKKAAAPKAQPEQQPAAPPAQGADQPSEQK